MQRDSSTQVLVHRSLAGDRAALRQLFAHVICPVIERRLADHVQEVLVHLLERDAEVLRRWDPERGALEPYVAKVADNHLISRRRKRPPPSPTDEADSEAAASASPEIGAACSHAVMRVLGELGDGDAALFRAVYLEELSPGEAADVLGISREAVHKRIQRLRVKLTELLSSPAALAT
jgi:RNA polymerase sigma factor (sigma-70 family)